MSFDTFDLDDLDDFDDEDDTPVSSPYEAAVSLAKSAEGDLESLRMVTDADAVDECFSAENMKKIDDALELLESLETLDMVLSFGSSRRQGIVYFKTLQELARAQVEDNGKGA